MARVHSFTALQRFKECKALYRYRYIERVPVAQVEHTEDETTGNRGLTQHAEIEKWLLHGTERTQFSDAVEKVLRALPPGTPEKTLYVNRSWEACGRKDAWAVAKIDYVEDGRPALWDWKTGRPHPEEHALQGRLYMSIYAVNSKYLEDFSTLLEFNNLYLDRKRAVRKATTMSRFELSEQVQYFSQAFNEIEGWTEWFPEPDQHCKWCPYSRYNGGPCRF